MSKTTQAVVAASNAAFVLDRFFSFKFANPTTKLPHPFWYNPATQVAREIVGNMVNEYHFDQQTIHTYPVKAPDKVTSVAYGNNLWAGKAERYQPSVDAIREAIVSQLSQKMREQMAAQKVQWLFWPDKELRTEGHSDNSLGLSLRTWVAWRESLEGSVYQDCIPRIESVLKQAVIQYLDDKKRVDHVDEFKEWLKANHLNPIVVAVKNWMDKNSSQLTLHPSCDN